MSILSLYLIAVIFFSIILCTCLTTILLIKNKISIETACVVPMLILCFVYTPVSWFTFHGLLGCTPYLSILFLTLITLTYYKKLQKIMVISYSALLLGLILHWFFIWEGNYDIVQVINVLVAYLVAAILNVIIVEDVKRKNTKINQEILNISQKDELTGLWNRRIVNRVLNEFENSYTRERSEYAVIVIDVNNFKSINDQYGHHVGDSALVFLSNCIQNNIRAIDYAFRLGGDEFLIVLSCESIETALNVCTKINLALNEDLGFTFKISISAGYEIRSNGRNINDILERADKHMYQNKKISHNA